MSAVTCHVSSHLVCIGFNNSANAAFESTDVHAGLQSTQHRRLNSHVQAQALLENEKTIKAILENANAGKMQAVVTYGPVLARPTIWCSLAR